MYNHKQKWGSAILSAMLLGAVAVLPNAIQTTGSGDSSLIYARPVDSMLQNQPTPLQLNNNEHSRNPIYDPILDRLSTGSISGSSKSARKLRRSSRHRSGVFGSTLVPFSSIAIADRWHAARKAIAKGVDVLCGTSGSCQSRVSTLADIESASKGLSFFGKLKLVNQSINAMIAYQPDLKTYRIRDHWAAPTQSVAAGVGDCEDYVILKMAILQKLGVPAKAMSVVVLKDTDRNLYHAVLAISTNKGNFVLDNVQDKVLLDKQLPNYFPLYSFSGTKSWIHGWKRSQHRQLALAKELDAADVLPGEAFATTPLPLDGLDQSEIAALKPMAMERIAAAFDTSFRPQLLKRPWSISRGSPR